ncbi:hypothetical protein Hanom_Chr13g01233921 [Helianthus anomalus]
MSFTQMMYDTSLGFSLLDFGSGGFSSPFFAPPSSFWGLGDIISTVFLVLNSTRSLI